MTYNITKNYEGKPSKNKTEETGLSLEDATNALDHNERLWRKNGGAIISRTETDLVCEESDGSETITWSIVENENAE